MRGDIDLRRRLGVSGTRRPPSVSGTERRSLSGLRHGAAIPSRTRGRCPPRAARGTRPPGRTAPSRRSRDARSRRRSRAAGPRAARRPLCVLEPALVEDRLRRGDPQLLGHERDREGQQRIQVEEVFARVVAGGGKRAHGDSQRQGRALPHAQQHPEDVRAPGATGRDRAVPRYQTAPPTAPAMALSTATASAPATTACVHTRDFEPIATM